MANGIGLTLDINSVLRPASLGTLRAWYSADSLVLNDGDAVAAWSDQSGNALHLAQATGANKPIYKLNAANGQPAVLFDGTNDYMSAALGALNAPFTIFAVVYFNQLTQPSGDYDMAVSIGAGSVAGDHVSMGRSAGNATPANASFSSDNTTVNSGSVLAGQQWYLIAMRHKTAATKLLSYLNSSADMAEADETLTANTSGALNVGRYGPGNSNFLNGYVAEILIFSADLAVNERHTVERFLQAKYGIDYFDPATSVAGLRSWFAADRITGLRDGDAVSSWPDAGPQAADAVQATGASQPIYKRDILNHKPVVRFDGSNDFLRSASFTSLAQPRTIFVVGKHNNAAAYHVFLDGIGTSNRNAIYYEITTGKLSMYAGTLIVGSADLGTGYVLLSCIFNGASSQGWKNSVSQIASNAGSQTLTGYTIGAVFDNSAPLNGDIAEILIYDGSLSTADRQLVEGYLTAKYAL